MVYLQLFTIPNESVCFFIGYICDGTGAAEEHCYGGNYWGSNMYPCSTAQLSKKAIAKGKTLLAERVCDKHIGRT